MSNVTEYDLLEQLDKMEAIIRTAEGKPESILTSCHPALRRPYISVIKRVAKTIEAAPPVKTPAAGELVFNVLGIC